MKRQLLAAPPVALLAASLAFGQATPTKVGTINIQSALIGTQEGQKAAKSLDEKSAPKRQALEKKQAEVTALQESLRKQSNTASEEVKAKLMREIDQKTKAFNRDMEDAQAELDQEQQRILQELSGKMMAVIDKYARDNGYAVVLDVSQQNSPVLYFSNTIDVTQEIIKMYDQNNAVSGGVTTSGGAASPPKPTPAAPSPADAKPAPKK